MYYNIIYNVNHEMEKVLRGGVEKLKVLKSIYIENESKRKNRIVMTVYLANQRCMNGY